MRAAGKNVRGGRGEGGGGAWWSRSAGGALTPAARDELIRELLGKMEGSFVPRGLLPGLNVPIDLTKYVTHGDGELRGFNYVRNAELDGRGFVDEREGHRQSKSMLEALPPFDDMMIGGGLKPKDAWLKTLALVVSIFRRVHEVRTVAKGVKVDGAYLYGMLKATALLKEYC